MVQIVSLNFLTPVVSAALARSSGTACVAPLFSQITIMVTFLTILTGLAMLATLGVLVAGMVGLVRGGGDPARSNVLMRWRVILQGVALLLFIALVSLLRS